MKITSLLNKGKRTLSFEVFPPKTDTAFDSVEKAVEEIADLAPAYISVTYGAGGGTSRYTLEIARSILEKKNVPILAHLTCVSGTKESVARRIREMKDAGIENVLALRGDLTPEMVNQDRSAWDYRYAVELVRDLKESGADFCVGAACYPEVHPESADSRADIRFLKEKVDAGVDFLTSQMFFDNGLYYSFLYRLREAGITVPVIPGIMPITGARQVERARKLSGAFLPQRFLSLVDAFGARDAAMEAAGVVYAADQIIDLYANGISHVHVYTMNKPGVARAILRQLKGILG
ncbi:MAG: methylenetetrahydrofolate reductase [Clostridia bacterium]|nr:methylenetetrahydrofolate reductase [Clostridia bacterium]